MPNVRIGNNVIIGTNSTATKDIADGVVVAENSAKVICSTEAYLGRHQDNMKEVPVYGEDYTFRGMLQKKRRYR